MDQFPFAISLNFIITTLVTVLLFFRAANKSIKVLLVLVLWLVLQMAIALTGFYTVTNGIPPRFLLLAAPAVLFVIGLFITRRGKLFVDSLDVQMLTILHIVRLPVELILYSLFLQKQLPELMTFSGRNYDILAGLTAPLIYFFVFVKGAIGKKGLLAWNIFCLGLLFNIVINAVLSVPSSFQQFSFEQPNVAILYFPLVWLPSCVVPIVLLSHLAVIRKLVREL
jgi:hypothetical protein